MKQREVNFIVRNYLTKDAYKKDGCPTLYYEFNKHEYYGLVAVRTDLTELEGVKLALAKVGEDKAIQTYLETIAGDTVDEIEAEGYPEQISKSEALLKFLLADDLKDRNVGELIKEFEKVENGALLIDSSLT